MRSVLFLPADRPSMAGKISAIAPDLAVLDLEDAIAPTAKDEARRTLTETLSTTLAELDATSHPVAVRVNPATSPWFEADLSVAGRFGLGVVLPKYEDAQVVDRVRDVIGASPLVVGLETARGVADCRELLRVPADACYFGAEDYIADLGGRRTPVGTEVLWARSQVVLACRLAGVSSVDQAVVRVHDRDAFSVDAEAGRDLGYQGKICLHPIQVEEAHRVFTPTPDEVAHARRVIGAAEDGGGLVVVDGQMIDEVHLKMARTVLDRAGAGATCASG